MSTWEEFSVETLVRQALNVESQRSSHFHRPYLTSYQIAIAIAEKHPRTFADIGKPIGGKDKGQEEGESLAHYIAKQLSDRIKDRRITDIEGGILHEKYLRKMELTDAEDRVVEPSTGYLSMFRLSDQ